MPNYWLVGAMWGGQEDQYNDFIERGYWELGWDDSDKPKMTEKRTNIEIGDRIAIKKMLGQGSNEIEIRAIGEVKGKSASQRVLFIKWFVTNLNRRVDCKNALGSIHGPYTYNDLSDGSWVREVFCI
jgi:hypothetical protein